MKNKLLSTIVLTTIIQAAPSFSGGIGEVKHIPGIFIGATTTDGETHSSYGLEYEYKFSERLGGGFLYEKTEDAHHGDGVEIKLAALYLHPWKGLKLGVGAGKEDIGGHHPHSEDLFRASISYDFHIGDFGIAPTLALDLVDDKTSTVLGIAIVRPF
ncbi:hypothetical protein [Pseudoteredinibacter isoporae]|uniref:hypothetical protein n=1 Tax=Pseudoteredinibacter isoporae TaxID=570281 RepID=UPI0033425B71